MYNGEKSSDWKHWQFNGFYACFYNVFIKVKKHVLCFYLQINVFNIYALNDAPASRLSHCAYFGHKF